MTQENDKTPAAAPVGAPRRKWVRWVLFASLAVNLLVVGLVGGAMTSGRLGDRRPPHVDRVIGPMTQALTRDDRRSIGLALRRDFHATNSERPDPRKEYAAILEALRAVPFDPEKVAQNVSSQWENANRRMQLGQKLLIDRLTDMSNEERAEFADRLVEALKDGPRKHWEMRGERSRNRRPEAD